MTATLDAAKADPQQTIAELRRQLDECRAELAARNNAYSERIDHQAATVDVLKVMSASPGDPQPVFDLIVERARDLCDGLRRDGVRIRRHADPLACGDGRQRRPVGRGKRSKRCTRWRHRASGP